MFIETDKNEKKDLPLPPLKWAGGKRDMASEIIPKIPDTIERYIEPFVGGGGMFIPAINHLKGRKVKFLISDFNPDLMEVYRILKKEPEPLIFLLKKFKNDPEEFKRIRDWDREIKTWRNSFTPVERAARIIYLNRTCYNGLYRINKKGQFNASFGDYKNPKICDEENIRRLSQLFTAEWTRFGARDFSDAISRNSSKAGGRICKINSRDFVFFDPPYDVNPGEKNFVNYNGTGFDREDQKRVRDAAIACAEKGAKVVITNADTEFIREIYGGAGFKISEMPMKRRINCDGKKRGEVIELLIES